MKNLFFSSFSSFVTNTFQISWFATFCVEPRVYVSASACVGNRPAEITDETNNTECAKLSFPLCSLSNPTHTFVLMLFLLANVVVTVQMCNFFFLLFISCLFVPIHMLTMKSNKRERNTRNTQMKENEKL